MKTVSGVIVFSILAAATAASCNDAQFSSDSGKRPASTATATTSTPGSTDGPGGSDDSGGDDPQSPTDDKPSKCVAGNQYTPDDVEIKNCMDQGLMWNFDAKQCTQMRKAEFDCSFDGFFAQLEKLRITPTEKLEKGRAGDPRPAMIVGCGESENKKTVLIQWFIPPEGTAVDCNLDVNEGLITTGCYGENSGQSTTDEEEKKRIVLNCMNGLAQ